jgi:hypothetical protein
MDAGENPAGVRTYTAFVKKLGAPEGRSPFSPGAGAPAARRPSTNLDPFSRKKHNKTISL